MEENVKCYRYMIPEKEKKIFNQNRDCNYVSSIMILINVFDVFYEWSYLLSEKHILNVSTENEFGNATS